MTLCLLILIARCEHAATADACTSLFPLLEEHTPRCLRSITLVFGMHNRKAIVIVLFLGSPLWSFSLCWNLLGHVDQSHKWGVTELVMHNQYNSKGAYIFPWLFTVPIVSTYVFALELALEQRVDAHHKSLMGKFGTPQRKHSWVGCHARKLTVMHTRDQILWSYRNLCWVTFHNLE